MNVTRTNASISDADFIYETKKECLFEYVHEIWGWDEEFQRRRFEENLDLQLLEIIMDSDREPIGILEVAEDPEVIDLRNIEIIASARNQGAGEAVILELISEARAIGKPITLRVFRKNRGAIRFYRKHGFVETGESEHHLSMRLDPDDGQNPR